MDKRTGLDLDFIKEMYEKFKGKGEANIRSHVVANFLCMIGYDSTEFYYEHPKFNRDGRIDIAVKIDEEKYFYVEVKNSDKKLGDKEQSQLAEYLGSSGLSWGILTNGREYILFNNGIIVSPNKDRSVNLDKMVLEIDIFNKRDKEKIQYFSKESMFETEITNYFKDIAQFKALKYPNGGSSWEIYRGTLYNFFKYYADLMKRYVEPNHIRLFEFEGYLKHLSQAPTANGKPIKSTETFANKYSHLRSFFQTLNVKTNGFDEEKMQLIKKFEFNNTDLQKSEILNDENISKILDFYDKKKDATRNKTVFLLCLCFGLERSTLSKLTDDSLKNDKLLLGERQLKIPPKLLTLFEQLKKEKKQKKVKEQHIFYTKYSNEYKPPSPTTFNYIFDILVEVDSEWKCLNPAYIRSFLIKQLFINNYSLEEIVYITGADLASISQLISYDDIVRQVKSRGRKLTKVHPFHNFLY